MEFQSNPLQDSPLSSSPCNLCPRLCGTDRSTQTGYCQSGNQLKAARAALHFWEEPCISGERGSGTVLFCGCQPGRVLCQNAPSSTGKLQGGALSPRALGLTAALAALAFDQAHKFWMLHIFDVAARPPMTPTTHCTPSGQRWRAARNCMR